ncbi:MAG: ABC transporter substrate-binding protein, partial [Desulfobacteraceae bacterium]|nr:ABC transporter substrate-binding protein [Desulfobacteraceae bacterium]
MKSVLRSGMVVLSVLAIIGFIVPSGALALEEVKIGVIYPLTGGAAAAGRELRAGAELAAKIANSVMADLPMTMAQNKGVKNLGGAKITLIFKDHEGNPTLGADQAKKLILD